MVIRGAAAERVLGTHQQAGPRQFTNLHDGQPMRTERLLTIDRFALEDAVHQGRAALSCPPFNGCLMGRHLAHVHVLGPLLDHV